MDEEALSQSIRKFLRTVGVGSQREIEQAVAKALAGNSTGGKQAFAAKMTLEIPELGLVTRFDGDIRLE